MILISLQTTQITSEGEQSPCKLKRIGVNWLRLPKESLSRLGLLQRASSKAAPTLPWQPSRFHPWQQGMERCKTTLQFNIPWWVILYNAEEPIRSFTKGEVWSFTGAPSSRLQRGHPHSSSPGQAQGRCQNPNALETCAKFWWWCPRVYAVIE